MVLSTKLSFDPSSLPSVFPYSHLSNHLKFHRWYYLKAYLSNHLKFHQWYHIKVHLSNYLSLHRFHLPSQQIPLQFFHRHFHHSIRPSSFISALKYPIFDPIYITNNISFIFTSCISLNVLIDINCIKISLFKKISRNLIKDIIE